MKNTENVDSIVIEEATEIVEETVEKEDEKENIQTLIDDLKAQYDEKYLQQSIKYEKRLKEREDVIKQLLAGDNKQEEKDVIELQIEMLNNKRALQNKKW